jgi:ubiquinone/menaquinone biosynthesis C-methylase UbiE
LIARLRQALRNDVTLRAVRATYPALNWLRGRRAYYMRVAPHLADMTFDQVRFSNRGNEPEAHLRQTLRILAERERAEGTDVLVLGVGGGDELRLWRSVGPRSLVATDYFAHAREWRGRDGARFAAADARALPFADASFDLVASTALLEHVDGVDACMREMARVTRPGGLVFANFGPLYWTYGGAHYLGAYEHLWMNDAQFEAYLIERGIAYEQQEALFWLRNGMFSRLTYDEYLTACRRYFDVVHVTLAVSPQALAYKRKHPDAWRSLCARYAERDLLTFGATVWLRARAAAQGDAHDGRSAVDAARFLGCARNDVGTEAVAYTEKRVGRPHDGGCCVGGARFPGCARNEVEREAGEGLTGGETQHGGREAA